MTRDNEKGWAVLCKRTKDPQLAWLQQELQLKGIESRRRGESYYAPILKVKDKDLEEAESVVLMVLDESYGAGRWTGAKPPDRKKPLRHHKQCRFIVIEYSSFFAVRDTLSGEEHPMGDGVDTLFTKTGKAIRPGSDYFKKLWQQTLNKAESETLEAYFPEQYA